MRTAILLIALLADFPAIEGWKPAGEVMTFDKQGLFKAVNGAAPLYTSYGFQELRVQDFSKDDLKIAVNIYDMGTPLNAYGIYHREYSSRQCLLLKDRFYVKVEALKGKLSNDLCKELTAPLASGLPGGEGPPAELELLPEKQRMVGSVKYTRKGFLGLGELNDCLHAEYTGEAGGKFQVFVIVSAGAWDALAKKWTSSKHKDLEVLTRNVPYRGVVGVVRVGPRVYGVADAGDAAATMKTLGWIASEVQSSGVK